jgi:Ribbon-helix-helix protein, copG family
MSDEHRRSERERRELAHQHADEVVEGSGRAVAPRRLDQMISLRLEPELAATLRELADRRGVTVSDLLREGAKCLLDADRDSTAPFFTWNVVSIPDVPRLPQPKLPQRQPA